LLHEGEEEAHTYSRFMTGIQGKPCLSLYDAVTFDAMNKQSPQKLNPVKHCEVEAAHVLASQLAMLQKEIPTSLVGLLERTLATVRTTH
jgi:hypothetical protein